MSSLVNQIQSLVDLTYQLPSFNTSFNISGITPNLSSLSTENITGFCLPNYTIDFIANMSSTLPTVYSLERFLNHVYESADYASKTISGRTINMNQVINDAIANYIYLQLHKVKLFEDLGLSSLFASAAEIKQIIPHIWVIFFLLVVVRRGPKVALFALCAKEVIRTIGWKETIKWFLVLEQAVEALMLIMIAHPTLSLALVLTLYLLDPVKRLKKLIIHVVGIGFAALWRLLGFKSSRKNLSGDHASAKQIEILTGHIKDLESKIDSLLSLTANNDEHQGEISPSMCDDDSRCGSNTPCESQRLAC
jgi:hypothetical protein